ncbi:unnamed protein product [Dicrocoelium dendriticum]|nr:unnamed protein product [Dicrocoelium dendriticum]
MLVHASQATSTANADCTRESLWPEYKEQPKVRPRPIQYDGRAYANNQQQHQHLSDDQINNTTQHIVLSRQAEINNRQQQNLAIPNPSHAFSTLRTDIRQQPTTSNKHGDQSLLPCYPMITE